MAEKLCSLETNPWKYVEELEYFYQYRELLPEVYDSCKSYMEEDMKRGGQWFLNIPYPGIQWLLLHYVDSIEAMGKFLALTVRTDQKSVNQSKIILISMEVQVFMNLLKKSDDDNTLMKYMSREGHQKDDWKVVATERCVGFVKTLLQLPKEECFIFVCSMLAGFKITDDQRMRTQSIVRDTLLEQFAGKYVDKEDRDMILSSSLWNQGKASVFHRLYLCMIWHFDHKVDITSYMERLYGWILDCINNGKVYLQYHTKDDQRLIWMLGGLLSLEEDTCGRMNSLLKICHRRLDGWNYDFERNSRLKTYRYVILAAGAMAIEWFHKKDRADKAYEMFDLVLCEGEEALYHNMRISDDQENFIYQYLGRMVLVFDEISSRERWHDIALFIDHIDSLDCKVLAVKNALQNLSDEQKNELYKSGFIDDVFSILNRHFKVYKKKHEDFDDDIRYIKKEISGMQAHFVQKFGARAGILRE